LESQSIGSTIRPCRSRYDEERSMDREERRMYRGAARTQRERLREVRRGARSGQGGRSIGGGALSGFLPWIIFWVLSSPSTWKVASVGALIAAVIVSVPDAMRPGGVKTLDVGTIASGGWWLR
jgi:hypothetical protein